MQEGSAGPADAECDVCTGVKRRAERFCLECVASYCSEHLGLHQDLHGAKRHRLTPHMRGLQERVCTEHQSLLEVYCRTDRRCICHRCIVDSHRGHDVVGIAAEVAEKQGELQAQLQEMLSRLQESQRKTQELQQAVETLRRSAQEAVEESERIFEELLLSITRRRAEVTALIRAQEEVAVQNAERAIERMEQEINVLKETHSELQRADVISHSDNACGFLQMCSGITALPGPAEDAALLVPPHCSFQRASQAVAELRDRLHIMCQWQFITITERVRNTAIVSSPTPQCRADFLQRFRKLTLDRNTAHESLRLAQGDRQLVMSHEGQSLPPHAERFTHRAQVLCREGLRGPPCYWEVEFSKGLWVCIAVAYKGVARRGRRSPLLGRTSDSWALRCYGSHSAQYWHNNKCTTLKGSARSSRVGVYLDHGAGVLTFFSVSDTLTLLHKVQTRFTEPLYPGFGFAGNGSHLELCSGPES